jgi:predicted amidophosphoribosyltransferase
MSDLLSESSAEVVRDRHLPRLCRSCRAPIARQEAACWRCRVECADEVSPRTTLPALAGGLPAPRIRVLAQTQPDVPMGRWVDDGGSVGHERVPAAATG